MNLRDLNREELDLWLGAYAGGYYAFGEKVRSPNKKQSVLPLNLVWLEANDDPEVRESNELLIDVVFHDLREKKPRTFSLFVEVYLGEYSNPAEPEKWKQSATEADRIERRVRRGTVLDAEREAELERLKMDNLKLIMLERGKEWILDQIGTHVLTMPDPIETKTWLHAVNRRQALARRVYWNNVEEHGEKRAREKAQNASGYSQRHLRRILKPREKR